MFTILTVATQADSCALCFTYTAKIVRASMTRIVKDCFSLLQSVVVS